MTIFHFDTILANELPGTGKKKRMWGLTTYLYFQKLMKGGGEKKRERGRRSISIVFALQRICSARRKKVLPADAADRGKEKKRGKKKRGERFASLSINELFKGRLLGREGKSRGTGAYP